MSKEAWRPVIEDRATIARVDAVVAAVTAAAVDAEATHPGLFGGSSGLAVFLAARARHTGERGLRDAAFAQLEHSVELLHRQREVDCSLARGLSGIAWSWTYVHRALELPLDPEQTEVIDELLVRGVGSPQVTECEFDLVYGLTGIGLYALERASMGHDEQLLSAVLARLQSQTRAHGDSRFWHTPAERMGEAQRGQFPEGVFNLGIAHGVPGVICLLASARDLGVRLPAALIEGAARWVESRCRHANGWWAPSWIADGRAPERAREAWCYGAPGVSVALARAGSPGARPLAEGALLRPLEQSGVGDPFMCHGSSGLALCHARLAQYLGDSRHRDRAREWAERTLTAASVHTPALVPDETSLLTGWLGVALILQSLTSDLDPDWDRAFGLSAVPAGR